MNTMLADILCVTGEKLCFSKVFVCFRSLPIHTLLALSKFNPFVPELYSHKHHSKLLSEVLFRKRNVSDGVVSGIGTLFSLDHNICPSDYDSDSVTSENQPYALEEPVEEAAFAEFFQNQSYEIRTSEN